MTAAAAPADAHEFLGITAQDCCVDCTAERCVITHAPICAHPNKGGLQSFYMAQPPVLARYNKAKKHLLLAQAQAQAAKEAS